MQQVVERQMTQQVINLLEVGLSNFEPALIEFNGLLGPSLEHVYQALKSVDPKEQQFILGQSTPGQAKVKGRRITVRDDWDEVKQVYMLLLLSAKFKIPEHRERLLATGDALLEEANRWHDTIWGICLCDVHKGTGKNLLGKMLMQVRESILVANFHLEND